VDSLAAEESVMRLFISMAPVFGSSETGVFYVSGKTKMKNLVFLASCIGAFGCLTHQFSF
jgi:hypothetical protein